MSAVQLSMCMIVRDSARTLEPALASIRPWVDEMVVVDTGSTDNTREIAASLGARVSEFPWCDDFAAARNKSLERAVGEWLFWMDSDDTISAVNGKKLRDLALGSHKSETMGYVMQVHCPGGDPTQDVTIVDHVKLVRNRTELRFEFRIHEQLLPSIRRRGGEVEWTDIYVTHSGSDHSLDGRRRKQERDLRLLTLELADRPDHPFALFNMGMTLADMDRHAEAVIYLERSVTVSEPNESHLRKAYALWVGSLGQIGQHERARNICLEALKIFPDDPELLFRWGIVAHMLQRFDEAHTAYLAVFRCNGKRHFSSRDRGITGFKARHNLALVSADMGRFDLAELYWREAIAEIPNYRQGWLALAQLLVSRQKLTSAKVEAERLMADRALRPVGLLLNAEIARAQGTINEALELLLFAAGQYPDDAEILEALCRHLFERGSFEEALPYQRHLAELRPEDPAVFQNLGAIWLRVGDAAAAVKCFESSLALRPDAAHTRDHLAIAQQRVMVSPRGVDGPTSP